MTTSITLSTRASVETAYAESVKASGALDVACRADRARRNEGRSWSADLYEARKAAEDADAQAFKALYSTQQQARAEFLQGRPKGWEFAPQRGDGQTLFTGKLLKQLPQAGLPPWADLPCVDHTEAIICDRQPVALVSHSYASREEIEQYATANHLNAEFLWWSWYYPGGCTAVLFTKGEAV